MSERIPMGEDIRQALKNDGWTLDEADEGIERIKKRGIGIGHEMARETMQASIGDAFREAKAEAWDEGMEAGQRSIILKEYTPDNPYREDEDDE